MRRAELPVQRADPSPLFDERAVRRVFEDAACRARLTSLGDRLVRGHALTTVPVRDEDAPVGRRDHVIRLIQLVRPASRLACRAE